MFTRPGKPMHLGMVLRKPPIKMGLGDGLWLETAGISQAG